MKKQHNNDAADAKPDLKHDSMEYSAATEGDDFLDMDDSTLEEDGITAEELEAIDASDEYEQADALNSVENDRLADEDNFLDEDVIDELEEYEEDNEENNDEQENERNR